MKQQCQTVVIRGDVAGLSVLSHPAKFGWSDVCLIERYILIAGSSWHEAGGIHTFNPASSIPTCRPAQLICCSKLRQNQKNPSASFTPAYISRRKSPMLAGMNRSGIAANAKNLWRMAAMNKRQIYRCLWPWWIVNWLYKAPRCSFRQLYRGSKLVGRQLLERVLECITPTR